MTRSSQTEYERVAGVLEACADAEKRLGGHPYRAKIMRRSAELLRRADALLRTPRGEGEAAQWCASRSRRAAHQERDGLTFAELRRANVARRDELLLVKRPDFRPEHAWSLNDWLTALAGEVGEVANLLKKVHRGDFTLDSVRDELAREIGDVQTYLDLLAYAAGIDLGAATAAKWNEVSVRVGLPHRIGLGAPAPAEATERSES